MRIEAKAKQRAAFWGLCLLLGSAWVFAPFAPTTSAPLFNLGWQSALLCVVFCVAGRRHLAAIPAVRWFRISLWGLVLALPALIAQGAHFALSAVDLALAFTLVPVMTVLLVNQQRMGFGQSEGTMRLLTPALMGVGGAALVLPFSPARDATGGAWLAAAVLAAIFTAATLVRLHSLLAPAAVLAAAGIVSGGWAILCFCFQALTHRAQPPAGGPRSIIWELLQTVSTALLVLLTVWLLQTFDPASFSARYLAVPLLTVGEGILLLRPGWSWALAGGVILMSVAVLLLLRSGSTDWVDAPSE